MRSSTVPWLDASAQLELGLFQTDRLVRRGGTTSVIFSTLGTTSSCSIPRPKKAVVRALLLPSG